MKKDNYNNQITKSVDILLISCDETYSYNGNVLSGIEYAKELRKNSITKPIVFTSFDTKENILKQPHTNIITAIGHTFLQTPFTTSEWNEKILYFFDDETKELEDLSDIQLKDILLNFCGLRSSLSNTFHDFKGNLRNINGSNNSLAQRQLAIDNEISAFKNRVHTDYSEFPNLLKEIYRILNLYDKNDITSVGKILAYTEDSLISYLPADEETKNESNSAPKSWKVLFLDDKPSEINEILVLLSPEKRNIGYAIATTVAEAKRIIENDLANQFAVVVSDYRLYQTDGTGKNEMQKKQGYDFLIWLSKQDRFNAMVALSGLGKWFLMDSFRKRQINVKVYSKNNVLSGGASAFVDDLEYLGNQIEEVVLSQPKATNWAQNTVKVDKRKGEEIITNYALKPYYVFHRNNNEYYTVENNINQQAEKVARELEYAIDYTSKFDFASLVSIQGNVTKTMKGDIENEYPNFQLKLLQRRVFYYLLLKGFEKDKISALLHTENNHKKKSAYDKEQPSTHGRRRKGLEDGISESMLKQIPLMLAMKTETDIPYGLLVEEKYFLHYYMNLPIYNIAELMDQTHSIINAVLTSHLKNTPLILAELKRYCVEDGSKLIFGIVSMNEVHVVLHKVLDLLLKQNKFTEAELLFNEIQGIISQLQEQLPTENKLINSQKAMTALKEKLVKRV